MAKSSNFVPSVVERLVQHFGSGAALCRALGRRDHFAVAWRREGFIPETWALDIERLEVVDKWGEITAYDVLLDAEKVRRKRAGLEALEGGG